MGLLDAIGSGASPYTLPTGLGANIIGGILKNHAENKRLRKIKEQQLAALHPLENLATQDSYGLSQSEGQQQRGAVQSTLGDLAGHGVLDSSISAPAVAGAVAPIQERHSQNQRQLLEYIASSKQAIAGNEPAPGFENALGGALGDAGGYLAMRAGQHDAAQERAAAQAEYIKAIQGMSQGGGSADSPAAMDGGYNAGGNVSESMINDIRRGKRKPPAPRQGR